MWGVRLQEKNSFAQVAYFSEEDSEVQGRALRRRHSAPDFLEGIASHQAPDARTLVYGQGYEADEASPLEERGNAARRASAGRPERQLAFDEHRDFEEEEDEDEDLPMMCATKAMRHRFETLHEEEDEDDVGSLPMMAKTCSMKSTGSSGCSWSTSTADSLGERTVARKQRPCKQKRLRLKKLVQKLINQYIANATGQGWADVALPQSLVEDRKQFLKVMKEVHEGVRQFQMEQQQNGVVLPLPGAQQWADLQRY